MTELRILTIVAWLAIFVIMLSGAWSAAFGRQVRRGDPLRFAIATTALIMAGFSARWLFWPDNEQVWQALYVLSIVNAIHYAILARVYGRGPYV